MNAAPPANLPPQFFNAWFANKEFSSDWTSVHFPLWADLFADLRDQPLKILEVGSWEGRSAVFFMEFFPASTLTCIDTFEGGLDIQQPEHLKQLPLVERRFDANLSSYGQRVKKIKSRSVPALDALYASNQMFDVIFIDGSHQRDDVLMDSLLCWRLSHKGTAIIWDDYGGGGDKPDEQRPGPGIDTFFSLYKGSLAEVSRGYQIIAQRR